MHGGLSVTSLKTFKCRIGSTGPSRDCKIKLGSLLAPSGRCTQSEGETLGLLLVTQFLKSVVTEELAAPATDGCTKRLDWHVVGRVVTNRRVEWAIDSFATY